MSELSRCVACDALLPDAGIADSADSYHCARCLAATAKEQTRAGRRSSRSSSDTRTAPDDASSGPARTDLDELALGRHVFRTKHPLRDWLLYVLVLGVLTSFGVGRQIVAAVWTDRSGLCVLLLLLFMMALVKSLFDACFLEKQMRLADRQIRQLWTTNNVHRFLRASEPSLLRQHVFNLFHIFRRDTAITQDNLISLLSARLNARLRPVDLCSSILVTVGLIGTIVGLIAAVTGLGLVIDNVGGDSQKLLAGMKETIGGMGTAFYTTLLGALLGGVFLRFIGNVLENNADFLVAHVAELTEIHILPVLRSAARAREATVAETPPSADRPDSRDDNRAERP